MLEALQEKLGSAIRNMTGQGKLTEENIAEALKEVRTALLSADVHFKVARQFINDVKEQCLGEKVIQSVKPDQMIIKIMHDELEKLLGEGSDVGLKDKKPLRVMMVGLHGSGKTTSTAKLALRMKKEGYEKPLVVACDPYRPAAIDQLETLARNEGLLFFADRNSKDVPKIAKAGMAHAKKEGADLVIFDTAGRLQIDGDLIDEIIKLKAAVTPDEVLLVADAALGQEAVNVAKTFDEAVNLTGIVMTKLDGDARGGAALSMKSITGVPIKFMGTGERPADFDVFHPDRMADRILGMGDVVTLVEKAQTAIDEKDAETMTAKMQSGDFTLEDFLQQMQQIKKLGPLSGLMEMMPGMGTLKVGDKEEAQMKRTEAIILSMTPLERRKPNLLNGSRRKRIANGSGTQIKDVNALLQQFGKMRKMMKMFRGSKGKKMMKRMEKEMGGRGMGSPGGMPRMG